MPEGQKAGPKGRQLEVGAQRAPKLLVFNILLGIILEHSAESSECANTSQLPIAVTSTNNMHSSTFLQTTELGFLQLQSLPHQSCKMSIL